MPAEYSRRDDGIQLRIQRIGNGWLLRAGKKPWHCAGLNELREQVMGLIEQFAEDEFAIPDEREQPLVDSRENTEDASGG